MDEGRRNCSAAFIMTSQQRRSSNMLFIKAGANS
jgi:hypothetical protein